MGEGEVTGPFLRQKRRVGLPTIAVLNLMLNLYYSLRILPCSVALTTRVPLPLFVIRVAASRSLLKKIIYSRAVNL
jgi:hypothetical protein